MSGIYLVSMPLSHAYNSVANWFFRKNYVYPAFGTVQELWSDASPINHVTPNSPPFLVLSASSDMGLEVDAQRFYANLQTNKVLSEYHVIPGTGHASIASKFSKHQAAVIALAFLRKLWEAEYSHTKPLMRSDPVDPDADNTAAETMQEMASVMMGQDL